MNVFLALCLSVWTLFVGLLDYTIFQPWSSQFRAQLHYQRTEGRLTSCQVTTQEGEDGATFGVQVHYQFEVASKKYESDRLRYQSFASTSDRTWAEDYVQEHSPGSKVTVYYDPQNPQECVLETGLSGSDLVLALLITPFNAVALVGWPSLLFGGNGSSGSKVVQAGRPGLLRRLLSSLTGLGISAGCLTFPAVFAVVFTLGMHPSLLAMKVVWGGILFLCGYLAWGSFRQPLAGAILIFPDHIVCIEGFRETTLPLSDLKGVKVQESGELFETVLSGPEIFVHRCRTRLAAEDEGRKLARRLGIPFFHDS